MRVYFTLVILTFSSILVGQIPSVESLKSLFPNEKAVLLEQKEHITIDVVDASLDIRSRHYYDKMMLEAGAQAYANHSIHFSPTFNEITDIDASLLVKSKKKFKKQRVDNIEKKSNYSGSIFYDDSKYYEIKYPNVIQGNRAVLNYTESIKDPHFLGAFYFSSYMPVVNSEIVVECSKGVKLNHKVFNGDHIKIETSKKEEGDKIIYTWKVKNVPAFQTAAGAPSISYYEPHIAVYIDHYRVNDETVDVLSGVSSLYNWYADFVKDVNTSENPVLKAIVDSLISPQDGRMDKVKKIFYWVQDNIKYVAFEDGLGGFIPRQAADVCDKRYGDCKDMASIITEMLQYANIEAYLTWIGSRDIPYDYEELPTPMVDNHMIASVKTDEGAYIFLDATGSYTPLGFPTSFIQEKEALIGISPEKYEIVRVPSVKKEFNTYIDTIKVAIAEDVVKGTGKATVKGLTKFNLTHRLINQKSNDKRDYLKKWLEIGNNKFLIEDYIIKGLDSRDSAMTVDYKFSIGDYYNKVNSDIYFNLNLDKAYENSLIDIKERKGIAKEFRNKKIDTHIIEFKIPDGYTVESLPENVNFNRDKYGFSIAYNRNEDSIFLEKQVIINTLTLDESDFESWNEMVSLLSDAQSEVVILKKKL